MNSDRDRSASRPITSPLRRLPGDCRAYTVLAFQICQCYLLPHCYSLSITRVLREITLRN